MSEQPFKRALLYQLSYAPTIFDQLTTEALSGNSNMGVSTAISALLHSARGLSSKLDRTGHAIKCSVEEHVTLAAMLSRPDECGRGRISRSHVRYWRAQTDRRGDDSTKTSRLDSELDGLLETLCLQPPVRTESTPEGRGRHLERDESV